VRWQQRWQKRWMMSAILHNSSYGYQGKWWTCAVGSGW